MFYLKLAKNNLKVNRSIYFPFLLSMIFLVVMNTIMQILLNNKGMSDLPGASSAKELFDLGSIIILIFSFIFSIYTNSFLLKQRKKELGLYNVLGLGKKEIRYVLFFEILIAYIITMIVGLLIGTIFSRLCFLILKNMASLGANFTFSVNLDSYVLIMSYFLLIFVLLFLWNSWQIRRMNPVELLKGTQQGEKEPKGNWFIGIVGLIMLGTAYYISVSIQSPLEAFVKFFIAVILVIIATYALFSTTSILILKLLKKNKRFYYQPNHFISVSSMMYRMKQNAAGLASISVLSTMVIITLSTTSSLYVGMEDVVDNRNPYDVSISVQEDPEKWVNTMEELANKHSLDVNEATYFVISDGILFKQDKEQFRLISKEEMASQSFKKADLIYFMTQDEFNRVTGKRINLKPHDIWLYNVSGEYNQNKMTIMENTFNIVHSPDSLSFLPKVESLTNTKLVVTSNDEFIEKVNQAFSTVASDREQENYITAFLNYSGEDSYKMDFIKELREQYSSQYPYHLMSVKIEDQRNMSNFIGGFLFLGVIFGLTFTLSTSLIIYYKQVSEGLQDKERFQIMQRIGMSKKEVKKSIQSQVLMVFFFPIALATLNLVFAFPIISKLLILFGLSNDRLLLMTCIVTVILFFIIYLFMYLLTSRTYYKLVERK